MLDRNSFPTPLNDVDSELQATDMAEECQRCGRDACGLRRQEAS